MIPRLDALQRNLTQLQQRVKKACGRVKRNPRDIKLVVVTKHVSADVITDLYHLGIRHIGENRIQEAFQKAPQQPHDITWHMVGHLQTNKVKKALEIFSVIHSLDSIKLAEEIEKQSERLEKHVSVFIQVNISGESSKFGIKPDSVVDFYTRLGHLAHLKVKGLMTITPLNHQPESSRPYFRKLQELLAHLKQIDSPNKQNDLKYLSMGMSQDFEIAIEEGANIIRIGTALFQGLN